MSHNAYAIVGGARDGGEVRVSGALPSGAELRFALAHDPGRCEVYTLGADGRLRFAGYGPAPRVLEAPGPALEEELRPLVARLGAALKELEAAYAARGLTPPPLRVNEWTFRRL